MTAQKPSAGSAFTYSDQVDVPTTAGGTLITDVAVKGQTQDVTVLNIDPTNTVYIGGAFKRDGVTALSTSNGFPLIPGASKTFRVSGKLFGIASTATVRVAWNTSEDY